MISSLIRNSFEQAIIKQLRWKTKQKFGPAIGTRSKVPAAISFVGRKIGMQNFHESSTSVPDGDLKRIVFRSHNANVYPANSC